ncbi:copper chaperone PCu(A)C [Streptomyces sp. NPDC015171]|uniref:copper chaperone PCu(A)C n=1 Tax=Streptomyces sp. NPDC015171 TaxID=3364945 RepID=UPI0037012F0F
MTWNTRRIAASFRRPAGPVLAPLAACAGALALLVVYAESGAAGGAPPRISVVDARLVAPPGAASAIAYFEIRNGGAAGDTLLHADSPAAGISMIRTTGPGRTERVRSVRVPAGGRVRMAPGGLGVVILDPPALAPGAVVDYNLWFRYAGRVSVRTPVVASPR